MTGAGATRVAGWYADPGGVAELRYWSGAFWTVWLSDTRSVWPTEAVPGQTHATAMPPRPGAGRGDGSARDPEFLTSFVERALVPAAIAQGILPASAGPALVDLTRDLTGGPAKPSLASTTASTTAGTTAEPPVASTAASPPVTPASPRGPLFPAGSPATAAVAPVNPAALAPGSAPLPTPVPAAAPRGPSRLDRLRKALGADLAVNGLAYLGVLLLFVGAFGLVAFAFADVAPGLRPVAEIVVAAVPLAGAAILLRSRATTVGRALELVGGLIVPIMAITSLVDGATPPPDPAGGGLPLAAALVCLASGAGSALWSRRHPESGLRYAVAPSLWLAAAAASLGLGRPVPQGPEIVTLTAQQGTALAAALLLTTALARWRPNHPLSRPALMVAPTGLVIAVVLVSVTARGPLVWWLLASTALLIATATLARLPERFVDVAGPLAWAAAGGAALLLREGSPPLAVTVVAGFLVLAELRLRLARPLEAVALPIAGLLLSLLVLVRDPAWLWPLVLLTTGWAALRRRTSSEANSRALAVVACVAPAVGVLALMRQPTRAFLVLAVLLIAAVMPAVQRWLRRTPTDAFWQRWWQVLLAVSVGAAAVTVLASSLGPAASATTGITRTDVAAAAVLLLLAGALAAIGPLPAALRPWAIAAPLVAAWQVAADLWAVPPVLTAAGIAGAAIGSAIVAHLPAARLPARAATQTALVALVLSIWSAVAPRPGLGFGLLVGLAAALVVCLAIATQGDRGRSPLVSTLPASHRTSWVAALVLIPAVLALSLWTIAWDASGLSPLWLCLTATLTAVGYTVLTHRRHSPVLEGVLVPTALGLLALGVALTGGALVRQAAITGTVDSPRLWQVVAALGGTAIAVALLPARRRSAPAVWSGWATGGLAAVLALGEALPALPGAVPPVAVGGALALAGATRHRLTASRTSKLEDLAPALTPASPGARRPYWIGAALLTTGLLGALATREPWSVLAAGATVLAVALLLRAGIGAGIGVALGWLALEWLLPETLRAMPWWGSAAVVALLTLAWARSRAPRAAGGASPWWAREEISLAWAALLIGLVTTARCLDAGGTPASAASAALAVLAAAGWATTSVTSYAPGRPATARGLGPWQLPAFAGSALLVLAGVRIERSSLLDQLPDGLWLAVPLAVAALAHTAAAVGLQRLNPTPRVPALIQGAPATQGAPAERLRDAVPVAAHRWAGALLASATWFVVAAMLELGTQRLAETHLLVGAAWLLGCSLVLRHVRADRLLPWAVAGAVVLGFGAVVVAGGEAIGIGGIGGVGMTTCVALLALAAAAWVASGTRPTLAPAAGVMLALQTVALPLALNLEPLAATTLAGAVAVTASLGHVVMARRERPGSTAPVSRAASALAGATVVAIGVALIAAVSQLTSRLPLAVALAALAAVLAAFGLAQQRRGALLAAPFVACVAWLLLASHLGLGGLGWYTTAIGVALLVVAVLSERQLPPDPAPARLAAWLSARAEPIPGTAVPEPTRRPEPPLVPAWASASAPVSVKASTPGATTSLEVAGIGFLVLSPLIESVTTSPLWALAGLGVGVLIGLWGIATRVRRRVRTAVVVVIAFAALLVLVPLAAVLPALGSAALWISIAVVGLAAVLLAAFLERGRTAVRSGFARLWGDDPRWR